MRSFVDKLGRRWPLSIDEGSLSIARQIAMVDPLDLLDPESGLRERLGAAPEELAGLLWALCWNESKARGIGAAEFVEALRDERAICGAIYALGAELRRYAGLPETAPRPPGGRMARYFMEDEW